VDLFLQYLFSSFMWKGAAIAVQIAVVSFAAALLLGLLLALMRESRLPWLRYPANFYVWFMRGTPLLLQLVFLYTVLPEVGLPLGSVETAMLGFALNEAAFCGEIIRGGIRSVNRNQVIAAQSLGMSPLLTLRRIVLPQALRAIVPALGNNAISLLKSTSLASVIAVNELTLRSQTISAQNFRFFEVYGAAAVIYLLMVSVLTIAQGRLEKKYSAERLRWTRSRSRSSRSRTPLCTAATSRPSRPVSPRSSPSRASSPTWKTGRSSGCATCTRSTATWRS
jgi:polar amino acid transport system permease protein